MTSADGTLAALVQELSDSAATVVAQAALDQLTTLRVGGPAALLVTVEDEEALVAATEATVRRSLPLLVLGRGSNLLVPDEGWPGVVLRLGSGFRGTVVDGTTVRAGGAEPMPSVALHTARHGLTGFAWGAAVPGTMGGGVRMNAGAHGADMAASLVSARILDVRSGDVEEWGPDRLELRYRHSALTPHHVVLAVELALEPDDPARVMAEIDTIRAWRREHQPLNRPSCGSVFTNPPGGSAGALIDRAGLKGVRIGGAEVSETHANFIVTSEGARAADVAELIDLVSARVREHSGITLRAEVVRPTITPSTDVP